MNALRKAADETKRQLILDVLLLENGNQCAAARKLGVHRNTMRRLINKFGIQPHGRTSKQGRRAA